MKKMNKMRFLAKTIISSFVLLAIFTACEVGLGSNVDTAAPKIEILSPEPSSTHKGEFQITGTASDEIAVRSVSVNLLENGTARYSYNANYDAASGKWSVSIPTLDENNKPIVEDLKYEIQAIATDTDGKTSVATRSVQVDNSAPTVLVNSPSLFNDNKSTFFRQLRVSGSCYDASEISSVKVYFYSMEDFQDGTSFDYAHTDKYVVYNAEGTNTWNLTVDLLQNDVFFENGKVYHFFVIAEDTAGNKNTYFYRMGDFYRDEVISDTTPGDSDNYIPFPSMVQIGKFDQGLPVENPTSGLTAEGLERIRKECSAIESNDSNFLYRSEAASNVSWGNIVSVETKNENGQIEIGPRAIPLGTDVTGQIKSTDGTTVMQDEVEFWLSNMDDENKVWKIRPNNIKLDTSETTTIFTVTLHDKIEEDISDTEELPPLKSGNYKIEVKYKTVASQNSDKLSAEQIFGVSAGMPKLTETKLTGKDPSPINVQKYSNEPVSLGGIAVKGDGNPINEIETTYNGQKISFPGTIYDGIWELEISEEGSHTYEFKVTDAGTSSSLNRTVIIDKTDPKIENMSFYQSADKKTVTISALVTDENSFEKIEYAFVEGKIESETELTEDVWKEAEKKNSLNIELVASDFGSLEFQQGPWTMWIKVSDPAGNEKIEKYSGILDLEAPEFSNNFKTTTIPENGYLNKAFYYVDSELSDDIVIATDNNEISKIEIVAKKDGKVSDTLSATKTINKKELKKSDVINLPVIEDISENEGKWIITFTLYDLNNNKVEKTVDFSMDVTSPKGEITVLPSPKSDKGKVEFGGTASDTLSGIDKVVIKYKDKEIECAGGTSWRGELDISEEGSGSVGAIIYDRAGNTFETNREFNIDFNNPTLTITSKTEVQTNETEYILSGAAEDSLAIEKIEITATKNGETQTGDDESDESDGIWKTFDKVTDEKTIKIPNDTNLLPSEDAEGKWIFTIKAYDKVGRVSEPSIINILVDRGAPVFNEAKITSDSTEIEGKKWYKGQTIKLEGQLTEGNGIESIEYFIGEAKSDSIGVSCGYKIEGDTYNFSANIPVDPDLAEAEQITIRAIDTFGNENTYPVENVYVDIGNPTIEIISNTSNIFIRSNTDLKLDLACDDAESGVNSVKARIGSPDFTVFDAETKSDTITISAEKFGKYEGNTGKVYLQVEDNCGNTAQTSFTFEKDTTSPTVKITSHSDGDTVNGKITLSGTTTETQGLAKVDIFVNGSDTASKIFEGNDGFNWSCEIDTTKIYNETGTKDLPIKVVATDNAGNESKPQESEAQEITLKIDQKSDRPEITLNNVSSGEDQYLTDTMILGVISDDDGPITALKIAVKPESGEIDWNNIPKTTVTKAGSFGFILSGDDGKTELCFQVEANGATFETDKSLLEQPKIMDVDEKQVENGLVVFNLDTNTPDINTENTKLIFGDNPEGEIFANNIQVGGKRKEFDLEVQASDGNGIKEVTLEVEGISDPYKLTSDGENWNTTVDTTAIDGLKTFKITVVDNAGASATLSKQILVDNQAPAIDIESHTIGETVLGKTRISGTTTDDIDGISGSGIKSVKWLVAKDTVLKTKTSDDDIIDDDGIIDLFINPTEEEKDNIKTYSVKGTLSWNYSFGDNNDNLGELVTNGYGSDIGNEIYELPIFFLIEDNVGNQKLEKIRLNVDPNGDKPRPFVSYPTDGAKLGGTVRINGTTEIAEGTVGKVYIQLGSVGDSGTFEPFEKSAFETWFAEKDCPYTFATIEGETVIEATGTVAWNITINSNNEFNLDSGFTGLTEEDDLSYVSFRVRAINTENKLGAWTDPITISLDKNAPKIANPRLVKYEGGDEIASKDYISGDWIAGDDWYLVTTIEDENGLASIEVTNKSDNATIDFEKIENVSANEKKEVKIPLKTKTFSGNIFSFSLSATDNSEENNRSEKLISLKFDNTPPDLEPLKHGGKEIDKETNPIEQDNNGFDISSSITEKNNGSDLERILLYFEDTHKDKYYVPMVDDKKSVLSSWTGETLSDGLPGKKIELDKTYGRSDERTIQDDSIGTNKFIKEGGVVRIGNILCRIESVDSSTGKVTIDTDVPTNFTDAEFIYALVIDNINGGEYIDQKTDSLENDDGDGFEEKLSLTGSTYDWSVVINSKEIPDGPVTMYYLAYDKAGNCSEIKAQETMVQNNRPAIAKVWLGTDLNGDNDISSNEEVLYRENETRETADGSVTLMAADFTAKGRTSIRPEIVGGNGNLYYEDISDGYANKILTLLKDVEDDENAENDGEDDEIAEKDETIKLELVEVDNNTTLEGRYDTDPNETETFTFKIWDSTPGLTPGDNSLSATITVSMKIDVVDGVKPTVVIDPLYWNSKTDNSLYEKSTENGHIELGSDLNFVGSTFTENSGVMDTDDKVSGKITFKGTAYDDVRLSSISFSFGSDFSGIAEYSGNTWDNPSSTIDSGYEFNVQEVSLDQRGHKVNWTLSIDTEKINGVASADVNLTVSATDKGSNSSSTEKGESEDETKKNVPSYKVDVVPYITGVQTALSGVNKRYPTSVSRSALGKYPVSDGEEVTFTGFNLGATTTYTVSQSGVYSHTVNEITALNNLNNDDAHGTYKGELNQDNYAEYAYNRQPNNYNNNLLTDDVEFVVWQFDSDAVIPKSGKIEQPIMKINPVSGDVGFAFVNGPLYFSMGGSVTENNTTTHYSYRYWMASYDFFTSVGFTYDALGNSYAVAAGGDINQNHADKFQLMSSRWGRSNRTKDGSYTSENSLRLESIGQKGDAAGNDTGTNYFDKQRIKSPAFATTVDANGSTNLYLAYYDAMNDEIRFKAGTTSSNKVEGFGSFTDYDTTQAPYPYRHDKVSMIAGSETGRPAGEYISLGAIKGAGTNYADVVVVVWYGSDRTLHYSYNTSPMNRDGQTNGDGWSEPNTVFSGDMENAGEYCKVVVDNNGGIHIAAYDPVNLDLCYAYLGSYNGSSFETCVVDSNGVTGSNLTLDVAKDKDSEDGNWIPYIGYYATYCIKPKYAYKVETSSKAPAGSEEDMFTQKWESMVVPTSSTIEMQSNQHNDINIAVWKDKDSGVLENSKTGDNNHDTNNNGYNNDAFGYVYGNGTSNPIMGYAIKSGASTNTIETAQLK